MDMEEMCVALSSDLEIKLQKMLLHLPSNYFHFSTQHYLS